MCVVAFAWSAHPRWRFVLAGNRDEFHGRPTAPLAPWPDSRLLAGRDLQSGGTWVGIGPAGKVAVVTNVRDGLPPPHAGPSRGALPVAFLSGDLTAEACTAALEPAAAAYAPFHLVLADAGGCWHLGNHPPGRERLAPGVHGISNGRLDAPWPKTRRLASALADWLDADADDPGALWLALAGERPADDDELPDTGVGLALERTLSPVFIRGPRYGTRASTLIVVDHAGRAVIHERRFGPAGTPEGETRLSQDP